MRNILLGQGPLSQDSLFSSCPTHAFPPADGNGSVQSRFWYRVPVPQLTLQLDHSRQGDHPPSTLNKKWTILFLKKFF